MGSPTDARGDDDAQRGAPARGADEPREEADAGVELRRRVRLTLGDALVHLGVVAALVAVYVSPITYESLLFGPADGGVLDAYRSILGHADVAHLLGNVLGFLVLAPLALVLLGDVSRRRLYYAAFAANLAVVPPLAALQWVLALELAGVPSRGAAGAGFSAVTAAFAGLLALALAVHARDRLVGSQTAFAVALGPLSVAVALLALVSGVPSLLVVALGLVALLALAATARALSATLEAGEPVSVSLSVVGHAAFLGAAVDLFVVGSGGARRPHAVGLALGVALACAVWGLERLAARRRTRG